MIWFVTPAFQRYALSEVCFAQYNLVFDHLRRNGVEATGVVIADDENLDIARAAGFETVERDNEALGRRFNDGMEYAAKHGAEWIVPIGSDSFIDPAYFLPLPKASKTRTSSIYAAVTATELAELRVGGNIGAGPRMFHRDLLEPSGFRPAQDSLKRSVDHSTIRGIEGPIHWEQRDVHTLQYIGFRAAPYITSYSTLVRMWGIGVHADPWSMLKTRYPAELVDRARVILG